MEAGVRGFGAAAVHCVTCDYAVGRGKKKKKKAPLEGIHNADVENRRLILRPERATQQICDV